MSEPAWHWEQVTTPEQRQVLSEILPAALESDFYMAGGTALAAMLGHRKSVDLDFFRETGFSPEMLAARLPKLTHVELSRDTLNGVQDGVRIQFLGFPYPLLEPLLKWEGLPVASILDIAMMKLSAIMSRGAKKDFVDLRTILETGNCSLSGLIDAMPRKFPALSASSSTLHLLKSLVYFEDAEAEPDPMVLSEGWSWLETRLYFEKAVSSLARDRLK